MNLRFHVNPSEVHGYYDGQVLQGRWRVVHTSESDSTVTIRRLRWYERLWQWLSGGAS